MQIYVQGPRIRGKKKTKKLELPVTFLAPKEAGAKKKTKKKPRS